MLASPQGRFVFLSAVLHCGGKPLTPPIMTISYQQAKKAEDKDWSKLEDNKAWLLDTGREYESVAKETFPKGKTFHAEQCLQRYLDLAKVERKSLLQVATPGMDDHQINPEDFESKGAPEPVASKIVVKVMHMARVGRPDLLWTVNDLARNVAKWNVACDRMLLRLIPYIVHTKNWV